MKTILYTICGLLLICIMSCKDKEDLPEHGCNDLVVTDLSRCNSDEEADKTTTITFRMKNRILSVEISPFEGEENIIIGTSSNEINGNYHGLINIYICPNITNHSSTCYYSLKGNFSKKIELDKGGRFEADVIMTYAPAYNSGIELNYHLEIGEGETVEWRVEKLCLENVLKQPDEE